MCCDYRVADDGSVQSFPLKKNPTCINNIFLSHQFCILSAKFFYIVNMKLYMVSLL